VLGLSFELTKKIELTYSRNPYIFESKWVIIDQALSTEGEPIIVYDHRRLFLLGGILPVCVAVGFFTLFFSSVQGSEFYVYIVIVVLMWLLVLYAATSRNSGLSRGRIEFYEDFMRIQLGRGRTREIPYTQLSVRLDEAYSFKLLVKGEKTYWRVLNWNTGNTNLKKWLADRTSRA